MTWLIRIFVIPFAISFTLIQNHVAHAGAVTGLKTQAMDIAKSMAKTDDKIKKLLKDYNKLKPCKDTTCKTKFTKVRDDLKKAVDQQNANKQGMAKTAEAGKSSTAPKSADNKMFGQLAQMMAAMMKKPGNQATPAAIFEEAATSLAAVGEGVGLSAGTARSAIQAAARAEKIEKSGILDGAKPSSSDAGGGAGLAAFGGGGSSSGIDGGGSPTDIPLPGSKKPEESTDAIASNTPLTFGGGSGGSGGGGYTPDNNGFDLGEDPLLAMNFPGMDGPKPASVDSSENTDVTYLNGEKIGTAYENVFEKVSRRYQFLKKANRFILDGD